MSFWCAKRPWAASLTKRTWWPNAIGERSGQGSRSDRRRRLDLDGEHDDGSATLKNKANGVIVLANEAGKPEIARVGID
jgi:hypothetical protein